MNNKTYQQLEFEPYVQHGVAKLRPKKQLTKDSFSPAAQEMAAVIYGLDGTNTLMAPTHQQANLEASKTPRNNEKYLSGVFTYKQIH